MTTSDPARKRAMRLIRTIDERGWWPTAVLTPSQWEVHRLLRDRLDPDKQILPGVQLSTFFDPGGRGSNFFALLIENAVLFAIVTVGEKQCLDFVILEEAKPEVESILSSKRVGWMLYESGLSAQMYVDRVLSRISAARVIPSERVVVNRSEQQVKRELMVRSLFEFERYDTSKGIAGEHNRLTYDTPIILHGVAIRKFAPTGRVKLRSRAEAIVRESSVDLLVHGRGASGNRPLLAIEVDGSVHEKPSKVANDIAKNEVLESFGLPFIRISPAEGDFWSRKIWSTSDQQRLRCFAQLLRSIAQAVAFEVQSSMSRQIEENEQRLRTV